MADILTPDLCVIGGGAAGLAAAVAGVGYGASVVLIERDRLGGERLHAGCVPTGALIASADHAHAMRTAAPFGIANDPPKVSFRGINTHVQAVIGSIEPQDSLEHYAAMGIEIITAEARFADRRTLKAGHQTIRARRFIIATGSRPAIPLIPGLEAVPFFTNESIFANTRKLTHLAIIGGGPTGMELAQAYRRLGSGVTVIDSGSALAGHDPELVEVALRQLREEGVAIFENTAIAAIRQRSMGIGVEIGTGGETQTLDVSHILVAAGRSANLEALDLERARVQRRKDDAALLRLDAHFATSNRRIYAIGDAAGGLEFTQAARRGAETAVRHALLRVSKRGAETLIARWTRTDPELAEIGISEGEATARLKGRFRVVRTAFAENDKAQAERRTAGFAKMICAPDGRILGAGIVGSGAGELAALFSLAISSGLSAKHLAGFTPPYPSLAEIATRLGAEFHGADHESPRSKRLMRLSRLLP